MTLPRGYKREIGLNPRVADRLEQTIAVVLNCWLVYRVWPSAFTAQNSVPVLLVISEGAVLVFLLLRRPTERISLKPADWLIAASGTFLPLLVSTGGTPVSSAVGATLMLVGMSIHIGAKFSLNRSFGLVAANRGVKQTGAYQFVRHPIYAGYMMTHAGYFLVRPSWWNALLYLTVWVLFYFRIEAEERVLRADPEYRALAERVRYRLLPGVY